MRVLVAPDKFRGTLTARAAAEAIASGWLRARPRDHLDLAPMADGGEGTMEVLVEALGGEIVRPTVSGPLGDDVQAAFGIAGDGPQRVAIVEMASASGLQLIGQGRRDPRRTSTRGTGDLIRSALDHDPAKVIVGLGGSATNDGGAGIAQALGVRLLDAVGSELRPGGAALAELTRIDATALDPRVRAVAFIAATDVDNPLTGPNGASVIYGPQKGATPEDVAVLDRSLGHLAAVVHRDLGIGLRDEAGAGAAGGAGFGLMAFLGARVRAGVDVVVEAVDLASRVALAGLTITGEGRFDAQSLRGKVPAGVLALARERSIPAIVLCGDAEPVTMDRDVPIRSLVERFGRSQALGDARGCLVRLAEEVAERVDDMLAETS